jgi:dolichyl-phosphate-mannose-protein mannosyltransferase
VESRDGDSFEALLTDNASPSDQPSPGTPYGPNAGTATAPRIPAPASGSTVPAPAQTRTRVPKTTLLDRLWDRLATTPTRARVLRWIGPVLVVLLAAATRLWHLADPHSLVFDETFYVKDAYTLLNLGYESTWPEEPNPAFEAGNVDTYTEGGAFVVHPPLGKWLIALGFLAFGAENSISWRIATAVVGILAVILLMVIAKGLFRSTLVATIAGTLMAIDGNAIVMSRVALLDNFGMFFSLLGFGAILLDRSQSATRLALWISRRQNAGRTIDWGPALWFRPWLLAAGVAFGLAAAIKWNGLYFLAAFAVYTLVVDALARRRAGVHFWGSGTLWKQGPVSFLLTVPIALGTYLVTFTGWFTTTGGYGRTWADQAGNAWQGTFSWVPLAFQSFLHMQQDVYNYHVNEHTEHPYSANPLTWLFLIRPTSMYFLGADKGVDGCAADYCGSAITGIANPLIWWAGTAALVYLVYRVARYREWRAGFILMGIVAGYLPWLLYLERTVYQFYTITFEPYMILAIAYVAWQLLGSRIRDGVDDADVVRASGSLTTSVATRARGGYFIAGFLLLAVSVSIFFWPMWTGVQLDWIYTQAHYWLPSWK